MGYSKSQSHLNGNRNPRPWGAPGVQMWRPRVSGHPSGGAWQAQSTGRWSQCHLSPAGRSLELASSILQNQQPWSRSDPVPPAAPEARWAMGKWTSPGDSSYCHCPVSASPPSLPKAKFLNPKPQRPPRLRNPDDLLPSTGPT